ncbi:MAG: DUF805 domain-containing protein [Pseudomonadota bacterium]
MTRLAPWIRLFFRFDGRISLRLFWTGIGLIALFGIAMGTLVLPPLIGSRFAPTVALLLCGPPLFAVTTKRFHDVNRSWWWNLLFGLPLGFTWVSHFSGLFPGEGINAVSLYWGLVSLITGGWALKKLGFERGVEGFNDHGPDPLNPNDMGMPLTIRRERGLDDD